MTPQNTIVALSTPPAEAALALVRLSGPACADIATSVFRLKRPPTPRQATYGAFYGQDGSLIDDVVYTYFAEGASFTGEAMLEISAHGNPLIVQNMIGDLNHRGIRLAEPGEFTRTAFLNGKLDLSQAEAVGDLIHARSQRALKAARKQLHGNVGRCISALTDQLLGAVAHLEAYIDFPEEDLPAEDQAGPKADLGAVIRQIDALIETQRYNAILHEGVKTLIIGPPNVGKSSLINALTGRSRAIVSEVAGTTRDIVGDVIMVDGYRIEVMDTAGVRDSSDTLEIMGIKMTLDQCEAADTFLLVLDGTTPPPTLPRELLAHLTAQNTLVLSNKADLTESQGHLDYLPGLTHLRISAKTGEGLDSLRKHWAEQLKAMADTGGDLGVLVNARHAHALTETNQFLKTALEKLSSGEPSELVSADLRSAIGQLGEVVGRIDNEQMLDQLFAKFCIGK